LGFEAQMTTREKKEESPVQSSSHLEQRMVQSGRLKKGERMTREELFALTTAAIDRLDVEPGEEGSGAFREALRNFGGLVEASLDGYAPYDPQAVYTPKELEPNDALRACLKITSAVIPARFWPESRRVVGWIPA
jgi:hypothetical protein